MTPAEFWDLTTPIPETGCWVYTLVSDTCEYGYANVDGVSETSAHRVAWVLANLGHGSIKRKNRYVRPMGSRRRVLSGTRATPVTHSCDVKGCVNPSHLRLGSWSSNSKEWWDRVRRPALRRAA